MPRTPGRPGPAGRRRAEPRCDPLEPRHLLSARFGHAPIVHAQAASAQGGRIVRDVVYQDAPDPVERLDLIEPAGTPPPGGWPVVVAIHGGGWRRFDKTEYEPTVALLARDGYLVVAPNYPLSGPGSPSWPANFEAVRDAVRWVRDHASAIGADPNRIATMGESAGGHLAALLGTYPDGPVNPESPATATGSADPGTSARVQAVVDFFGPTDLAALSRTSRLAAGPIRHMLGADPSSDPGRAAAASPVSFVSPDDPPTLIFQGTADPIVTPSQSTEFADALTAAGVPNRLIRIPGAGHGFGLSAGGRDLLGTIERFLASAMPAKSGGS